MVMPHQRPRLIGNAVPGQQDQRQRKGVLAGQGRSPGPERNVEAPDASKRLPAEGHVGAYPERRQWVQRALRAMAGENGRREAAILAMPAELLEQLLCLSVKASRKDQAGNTRDVITPSETRRQPGQPVTVGFLVIVEEGNDLAGRGGRPGVAGP